MKSDIMDNIGVEVNLVGNFKIIKEILERIGIANKKDKILYPSCNILHKKGKYYIVHFKELFKLDGKESTITHIDLSRRDSVVYLLTKWNFIKPVQGVIDDYKTGEILYILKRELKEKWQIKPKYRIGKKIRGEELNE